MSSDRHESNHLSFCDKHGLISIQFIYLFCLVPESISEVIQIGLMLLLCSAKESGSICPPYPVPQQNTKDMTL